MLWSDRVTERGGVPGDTEKEERWSELPLNL